MFARTKLSILSLLVALVSVSCSQRHSAAEPVDDEAETDVRVVYCEYLERCAPEQLVRFGGTVEGCVRFEPCDSWGLGAGRWNADVLKSCAALLPSAVCRKPSSGLGISPFASVCQRLVSPIAQEGESCLEQPCELGLHCPTRGLNECPVCERSLERGERCVGGVFGVLACQDGLICDRDSKVCAPPRTDGTCRDYSDCPGEVCSGEGRCQALVEVGGACSFLSECASRSCFEGTCRVPAALGQPCYGDSWSCESHLSCKEGVCAVPVCEPGEEGERCPCALGSYCTSEARCQRIGKLDEPCPSEQGQGAAAGLSALGGSSLPCEPDLFCEDARCQQRVGLGESCKFSSACRDGLFCTLPIGAMEGSCAARRADGEPCESQDECTSGRCFEGQCGAAACISASR